MFGLFDHFRQVIVFDVFVTRTGVSRRLNFRQLYDLEWGRRVGLREEELSRNCSWIKQHLIIYGNCYHYQVWFQEGTTQRARYPGRSL